MNVEDTVDTIANNMSDAGWEISPRLQEALFEEIQGAPMDSVRDFLYALSAASHNTSLAYEGWMA